MAEAVIGAVRLADSPGSVAVELQEGVARLQQAAECQKTGANPISGAPAATLSLAQDPELLSDFIVESGEHLANL
jgi:hypothetical protein